ncbi:hypothetical protein D3C75_1241310 [compost metagenome]
MFLTFILVHQFKNCAVYRYVVKIPLTYRLKFYDLGDVDNVRSAITILLLAVYTLLCHILIEAIGTNNAAVTEFNSML